MAESKPAILGQIEITDSNKWIDFLWNVTSYSASIAVGMYENIQAVLDALEIAMEAAASAPGTCTHSTSLVSDRLHSVLNMTSGATAFSIYWQSGAHAASSIGHVLGFDVTANDTGANEYVSDFQCQSAWISNRAVADDSYNQPEHVGGELRQVTSGTAARRLSAAVHYSRSVRFPVMLPVLIYLDQATGADLNRDLETLWVSMMTGKSFRYYPDRDSLLGTSSEPYYLDKPTEWMGSVIRKGRGIRRHEFELMMKRKET